MDNRPTRYEALRDCVTKAGSISKLGRDLDIPQSTMSRIVNSSKQLPAEYVITAERLYGISRHDLRPDIYPREAMTDARVGQRFTGVDHKTVRGFPHAADGSRLYADDHFNRGDKLKAAQ